MNRLPALAARNVGRNRRRTLITALTIVVGVAMSTLVRGVTNGMQNLMEADTVQGRVGALQVHKKGFVDSIDMVPTALNLPYSEELKQKILGTPHVTAVTGRIQFTGLISNGLEQTMFTGRGQDMAHEAEVCPRTQNTVKDGSPLAVGEDKSLLVGYELAESFHLKPGQTVTLQTTSPTGRANSLDLKLKGLTVSNLPFENKRVATVTLPTAQALLGLDGRVTEYALAVDDVSKLDEVADALRAKLGDEYEVHTWRELQPFVRDLLARLKMILGIVGLVLFVVVLTGIINTMLMSAYERVREIGTMLAVGVRRAQVLQMFLIEAGVIGVMGGVVGTLIGRTAVAILHSRGIAIALSGTSGSNVLRPEAPWSFTAGAFAFAVLGSVLAALWPAWRASQLNPVDALRTN